MKKPLIIEVDKTKNFFSVLYKCAEALQVEASQLRLEFDGEKIDLNEKPSDLDFEDGDIVDCLMVK